jgi:hypothetical protein
LSQAAKLTQPSQAQADDITRSVAEDTLPDEAKFVLGAAKGAGQAIKQFWNGANLPAAAYPGMQKQQGADLAPHGAVETAGSIIGPLATPAGEEAAQTLTPAIKGAWEAIPSIPTTSRAGKLFTEVMDAAKDKPVNLTRTQPALERVAQLTDAGAPVQTAPNKLLLRSQTISPLSYQDARDFYSNISNLSAQDKLGMNGPMKKAVGDLRVALKADIGDTAATVGKGPQYEKAMKQYQAAMRNKNAAKTVGNYAVKTGATAAGLGAAYSVWDMLRDLAR